MEEELARQIILVLSMKLTMALGFVVERLL